MRITLELVCLERERKDNDCQEFLSASTWRPGRASLLTASLDTSSGQDAANNVHKTPCTRLDSEESIESENQEINNFQPGIVVSKVDQFKPDPSCRNQTQSCFYRVIFPAWSTHPILNRVWCLAFELLGHTLHVSCE